jgi:hypothetical protein
MKSLCSRVLVLRRVLLLPVLLIWSWFRCFCRGKKFLQAFHKFFELSVAGEEFLDLNAKLGTLFRGLLVSKCVIIILHVIMKTSRRS